MQIKFANLLTTAWMGDAYTLATGREREREREKERERERERKRERKGKRERETCFMPRAKDLGRYSARSCAQPAEDGAEELTDEESCGAPVPPFEAEGVPDKDLVGTHITLPSGPITALPVGGVYDVGREVEETN